MIASLEELPTYELLNLDPIAWEVSSITWQLYFLAIFILLMSHGKPRNELVKLIFYLFLSFESFCSNKSKSIL